jgi:3',5'-cyclic AMP phosphodiesterase CpdA
MRLFILFLAFCSADINRAADLKLPLKPKSVRFGVIGDSGSGLKPEFDVGREMMASHEATGFDFVVMLGDDIYGGKKDSDFKQKFEDPYRPLLDAGVKFFAVLGNHDGTNERFYKPFNMGGKRYYSFKRGDVEFFALDSNYMDADQISWLETQLSNSGARWKVCYFHHPLYSDGRFHGPDLDLRRQLEPIFVKHGVNLVLNGHEHFYERLRLKNGIAYFVLGNSGKLRPHSIRPSGDVAKGYDTDQTFALMEIAGDELYFQAISRKGETVDSGVVKLPPKR